MTDSFQRVRQLVDASEQIIIGAGAGLSAAAGLQYDGPAFQSAFADFIERYAITDLYSSSFFPFATEEEYWACWARHIDYARFQPNALPLYQQLFDLVKDKDYFVLTTNVDGQFRKAGFADDRLFEVQGDYAFLQCAKACHETLYYNYDLVQEMVHATKDCRIPTQLVPRCPRCGGKMAIHVRTDAYFIEDKTWRHQASRATERLNSEKKTLLLELGVGFNTPTIIRFPFEQLVSQRSNFVLARINKEQARTWFPMDEQKMRKHAILIQDDIAKLFL